MIKTIVTTPKYNQDYKKLKRKHYDMNKLHTVINLILNNETELLRTRYRDHQLKGEFKHIRECHIEADWLLLYQINENELELWLMRTGSHDKVL